jgi:hypothetical protein
MQRIQFVCPLACHHLLDLVEQRIHVWLWL